MEEKLIITDEMVGSLAEMFKGTDDNVKFAYDILSFRDKDNKESEANFNKITNIIIFDDKLFPVANKMWILKMGGKRLVLNRDKATWKTETEAQVALSRHLTDFLGQSGKNVSGLDWHEKNKIKWKCNPNTSNQRPSNAEYQYDPNFDIKKFKREVRDRKAKEMSEVIGYYARYSGNSEYFRAMKKFFKGGRELRDFLLENKIVEIVQL